MKRQGLTLIEVSMCIVLLALLATGMVNIFSQGSRAALKTKERAVACSLARGVMENYADWSQIPSNGTYTVSTDTLNGVTYTSTLTVSGGPVSPASLKRLAVTVSWGTGSVRLDTLKADF